MKGRKIFIDCGGYDGCSVIKFLLERPDFKCYTFEPNPLFSHYYRFIPTTLIKKAVYTENSVNSLLVDPIDGDGSTLINSKKADATNTVDNDHCERINVNTSDLSEFILKNSTENDYIVLKMDIEGAEYVVLEKLLETGIIKRIKELYIEFHWEKMGVSENVHYEIVEKVSEWVKPRYWDSREYAVHQGTCQDRFRRYYRIIRILFMRLQG